MIGVQIPGPVRDDMVHISQNLISVISNSKPFDSGPMFVAYPYTMSQRYSSCKSPSSKNQAEKSWVLKSHPYLMVLETS